MLKLERGVIWETLNINMHLLIIYCNFFAYTNSVLFTRSDGGGRVAAATTVVIRPWITGHILVVSNFCGKIIRLNHIVAIYFAIFDKSYPYHDFNYYNIKNHYNHIFTYTLKLQDRILLIHVFWLVGRGIKQLFQLLWNVSGQMKMQRTYNTFGRDVLRK